MKRRMPRLALVAALLCAGIGWVAPVNAGPILMTPSGLAPGTHFRFVFVTDGSRDATSSTITDYDTFVNTQAGGATYNGSTVNWLVIGSTPTVNAITHITGPQTDPVYLADGTLVAQSTTTTSSGLWSGALLHAINEDLNSALTTNILAWTGTLSSGLAVPLEALGNGAPVAGATFHTDSAWVNFGNTDATGTSAFYGISMDLVVPGAAVPEPSSLFTLGIGLGVTTVIGWTRYRRQQRRQAAA